MYQGQPPPPIKLLVELRESHPQLKRAMTMQSFRAGQVLGGPTTLQRNLFALVKGRVQMNLNGFRETGLVELGYRRIVLRDPAGLRMASGGLG